MLLLAALLCGPPSAARAQGAVEGRVVADDSGRPLAGASVRVPSTERGSVTGADGRFAVEVAQFPVVLAVSHVGHQSERLRIEAAPTGALTIRLAPRVYELGEAVVRAENAGPSLMRSVIAQKARWQPHVRTQTATEYSRLTLDRLDPLGQEGVLRAGGRIMLVSETAARTYQHRTAGTRAVVYTRRASGDLHQKLPVHATAHVPDLYADAPVLQGLALLGPTHPDALRHYTFTLAQRREVAGRMVYDINVAPKTVEANTFVGTVSVLDEPRVIVRALLRPAPHVAFPAPVRRWDVGYTQFFTPAPLSIAPDADTLIAEGVAPPPIQEPGLTYRQRERRAQQCGALGIGDVLARLDTLTSVAGAASPADDAPERRWAWVPRQLQMDGTFRAQSSAGRFRTLGARRLVCRTAHRLNVPLPAAPFDQESAVVIDREAVQRNPFFVEGEALARLPAHVATAFERLEDRDLTLGVAFPTTDESLLASVLNEDASRGEAQFVWPKVLGYEPRLRYNRVDGHLVGLGNEVPITPDLDVGGSLAMAAGLRRTRYHADLEYRPARGLSLRARYQRDTAPQQASPLYSMTAASLPARLGGPDYFDYYWQEGAAASVAYDALGARLSVGGRVENHASVERGRGTAWPFQRAFRTNPAVEEGQLYAGTASLTLGRAFRPFQRLAAPDSHNVHLGLHAEHSSPALGSDFDFTRLQLRFDGAWPTFFRRRATPNELRVRVLGSRSLGTPPVQRLGALDGSLGGYAAFGALRSLGGRPAEGAHTLGLFWEHDFGSVPFEALGFYAPARLGMGLALHGGHGRAWLGAERRDDLGFPPRVADAFRHEVGLSLTRVGGWPLRLGTTVRVDEPGVFLEFGLSY